MRIFTDKATLKEKINGNCIFIDGDFLGKLFEYNEILNHLIELLPDSLLLIDPYIELEFRRDVFYQSKKY